MNRLCRLNAECVRLTEEDGVKREVQRLIQAKAVLVRRVNTVLTAVQKGKGMCGVLQGISVRGRVCESARDAAVVCWYLKRLSASFSGQSIDPPIRQKRDSQCEERSGTTDRSANCW